MTTDYRALCAELLAHAQTAQAVAVGEGLWDGSEDDGLFNRAREALAQPEPVGPTDEELLETAADAVGYEHVPTDENCLSLARAVLARYARPTITPIPVSERLPGPEDCDGEGRCWTYDGKHLATGCAGDWRLRHSPYGSNWSWRNVTHWLPAHALPLPRQPAPTAPAP